MEVILKMRCNLLQAYTKYNYLSRGYLKNKEEINNVKFDKQQKGFK